MGTRRKRPFRITGSEILFRVWKVIFRRYVDVHVHCHSCLYKGPLKAFIPVHRAKRWYFGIICPVCNAVQNVYGVLTVDAEIPEK